MDMEAEYQENKELYDQAFEAAGYGEVLEEYDPETYSDPLELLDEEERKKVVEIVKAEEILNGNTGALAGMELEGPKASD
ncbi:MAG: hypothetical protein ABEK04_03895 [Candidatus Nanohalobium sp.]